jgi:hypothetical protein
MRKRTKEHSEREASPDRVERFSLFADLETRSKLVNEDYEKEKKREKEKHEKQFTMFFSSCEQKGDKLPWYAKTASNEPKEKRFWFLLVESVDLSTNVVISLVAGTSVLIR